MAPDRATFARRRRLLGALLARPDPVWDGEPLKPADRIQIERALARNRTLADVKRAKLDEMDNLVVGEPASAIDAPALDGSPRRLADHRGKVVVAGLLGDLVRPVHARNPPASASWPIASRVGRSRRRASTATPTRKPPAR